MDMPDKIWAMKDRGNGHYGSWDCAGNDDLERKHPYIHIDVVHRLLEEAAEIVEARSGDIPYRQEIAKAIRSLKKESKE